MNRDHVQFLMVGLMVGFVLSYFAFEQVASRQPERRPANEQTSATEGQAPASPTRSNREGGSSASGADGAAMGGMEQVQRLRRYVEENPEDSSALRVLANMNFDIQNWMRAAELYERLLELEPEDHDVMTDLGITYRNLSRPSDALEKFRQVQEADPDHWHSMYNEILVLTFDLKDFEAAGAGLEKLETLQPDNPDVGRLAAEVRRLSGA